jgi:deazaflavin-dependent oxidoreductase (nitroreductase family)
MTATASPTQSARSPRLGGLFLRAARATTRLALPFAGKRWNPIFSVVRHTGRRSGRTFEAPIAARRLDDGFVLALAFGRGAHWYRNLVAAGGGVIRWRGVDYPVGAPTDIDENQALAAFLPIQRAGLRPARIDGYVHVPDATVDQSASNR